MENRTAKVIIGASGGTAGPGGKTYRVTIPSTWITSMGVTEEDRTVELSFDGDRIILSRPTDMEHFLQSKLRLGHQVKTFLYRNGEDLCTKILADFTDRTIRIENHTDSPLKTAFGRKELPTWDDFQSFLEERCIPRERAGIRQYLEALGLEEYDPLEIVKRTKGRMAEDDQWIEIPEAL